MYRIDISGLELEKLTSEIFNKTNLKYLVASNNQLTQIPAQMFAHLKDMMHIDFSYNQIEKIDPSTFAGLGSLEFLNLSHNAINTIDENTFRDTGNLTSLLHAFDHLTKLKYLFLSHNHLKEVNALDVTLLPELKLLDIRYNELYCSCVKYFLNSIQSRAILIPRDAISTEEINILGITCVAEPVPSTEQPNSLNCFLDCML